MKLNQAFDTWATGGGIFSTLQSLAVPWQSENIAQSLDYIYHGNRSGGKWVSPLVQGLANDEPLTKANKTLIANGLLAVYLKSWQKEYATLSAQYDPIENYSMVEQMTNDTTTDQYGKTTTRTDDLVHSKTGTEEQTPDLTDTETPNTVTDTDNNIYGFNSSDPVPTGEQKVSQTGTTTRTRTGNDVTEYDTEEADTGTQTTVDSGSDTHTRNYRLTRSGNIGVTTSQQMLQSERDLWLWSFFTDVVFPQLDEMLVLGVY